MSWSGEFKRRLHMLLRKRRFQRELDEEIQLHLELREKQQIADGVSGEAARIAARRRFGNATRIREESEMGWGWEWLESFIQDTAYGVRSMLRSPSLALVALASLAMGIGANTAIFSLMDAVMLRSLPVKDPQQLVLLGKGQGAGISGSFAQNELYSYPFYRRIQQKNEVFSAMAAICSMTSDVHGFVDGRTDTEPLKVKLVSGTYFPMLGIQARMGRVLSEADDNTEGDHPVVVLSDAFWKRRFASDANVLGKTVKLGTTVYNVVGVAPPEFFGTTVGEEPDMWAPLSMVKFVPPGWGSYTGNFDESLYLMGRLKPGVSVEQAASNVNVLFRQILLSFPDAKLNQENLERLSRTVVPLTPMANGLSGLRREYSDPLRILMVVVALVLLIACANIANLLLARSTVRARELAVRQALGAGRLRIVRQLLTESLTLALAGGALGVGLAAIANRLLLRMVSNGVSSSGDLVPLDISLDMRLLAFTFGVTVLTAVLFGTVPALLASRTDLTESLKESRGGGNMGTRNPLAKALVISQIALSLVLLIGAGLFLKSLANLNNVDTGFNKSDVLLLQIDSNSTGYKSDDPRLRAMFHQIEERVRSLHGVEAASFSAFTFHEGSWNGGVRVPGMPEHREVNVKHNVVGNDYFKVMQIPLVAGRTFGPQDTATSQKVAVITEHLAQTFFGNQDVIGHTYNLGSPDDPYTAQVIGIVKDVKFASLNESTDTLDYLPYTQREWGFGDFDVRYTGDFNAISTEVQQAIHGIDRRLPITHVTTLDAQVARSITNQRIVAQLSTFFGLLAVFLSCIGIYGLMSYVVSRRTNEIGIRMALGASQGDVRWLVTREVLWLVGIGVATGIPSAMFGEKLISKMLYGVKGTDPLNLMAATVILLVVAAGAGYFPTRRATMVDPMVALRYE